MKKLFLAFCGATMACGAAPAPAPNACTPLPLGSIAARGWLREQLVRNRDGLGGHMDELEPQMMGTPYTTRESYKGWGKSTPGWGAEISGNYWQGLVALAWTLDDPALKAKAARWVEGVMKNAEPSGYLGTYKPTDDRHEDYNASNTCGYLALLDFADATGRADVFEAVHKALLWFCENWAGDRKTRYGGLQLTAPMLRVYARTHDKRLLDFTLDYQRFLEQKDLFQSSARAFGGPDFEYNANHAVAYANRFSLPALIFGATGERRYLEASCTGFEKLRRNALFSTGAVSGNDEYLSAPRANAESEYCGFAGLVTSYARLLAATGDTRWGDYMEETVFNAAQGARKKDEKALQYFSSPNMIYAAEQSSHSHLGDNLFGPVHPVACCAARFVQVLPEFTRALAFEDAAGALVLAAYAPCAIRFAGAELVCDTRYPFTGALRYTVRTPKPVTFTVRPKKPYWCDTLRVAVNGEADASTARTWRDGDTLDITLDMKSVVARFDDKSAVQPLYVKRGALVFALPLRENWTNLGNGAAGSRNGHAPTPLPKGWAWWRVTPVPDHKPTPLYETQGYTRELITWNIALDEKRIAITEEETQAAGYVWENPPVKLHLTGYKAPFAFAPYPGKTTDYQVPLQTVTRPVDVTLVPYGCTALRITYFPRCDASRLRPDLSFRP